MILSLVKATLREARYQQIKSGEGGVPNIFRMEKKEVGLQ